MVELEKESCISQCPKINNNNIKMDSVLWTNPNPEQSNMYKYMQYVQRKYPEAADCDTYDKLHDWSVTHLNDFWSSIADFCKLKIDRKNSVPLEDQNCKMDIIPKWFKGAKLNFAEQLLLTGPQPAIQFISERDHSTRTLTRNELRESVGRLANALRSIGLVPGDRVGAFCANVPEVVIFALAAAAIGASYAAASADFGADAVIDRFEQVKPKVILVGNAAFYNGKIHDQTEKVKLVLERLECVEQCIIVNVIEGHQMVEHEKVLEFNSFTLDHDSTLHFTPLPFDHPLYIMFSSGTTGKPKCIVHGAGGTIIQHLKEHYLHMDLQEGDVFFQFTLTGWMMWQWMVSALALGVTIVLHDGSPLRPDPLHLWRKITDLRYQILL